MTIDRASKDQIYTDYHDKVMRYVRGKIANAADAEDTVSEVFIKVYGKLDTFDESKASLSTWIYHIAQNTVTDYYRKRRVFGDIPETTASGENIEDNLIKEEQLERLADGLERLDERTRRIIVLRYYNGMKLKDIADRIGISYVYVKVLHKKALETLKKYIDEL